MTPLDLAVGEFGLADKIQPYEHIQGRLNALRKAYAVHPEIAREVISYAWPHAQNRPWTHEEIHDRLGLTPPEVAEKTASRFLKGAAAQFVQQHFPAFGAAFDAFEATRAQQDAIDAMRERAAFPAMHFTQPLMASYASGEVPPVHHRHRHHHKEAGLSALATALLAAGGHFGTNALGMAGHHGSNIGEVLSHRGFQHGLLGQAMPLSRHQSIKSIFGPESLLSYEQARKLGAKLVEHYPGPVERNLALKHLAEHGHLADGIPVAGDIVKALHHELANTAPTLTSHGAVASTHAKLLDHLSRPTMTGMETGPQWALKHLQGVAPLAAATAVDAAGTGGVPVSAALHVGFNAGRQGMAASPLGAWFAKREFKRGLRGEVSSPRTTKMMQFGLSPAIQDAQIAGNVVRQKMIASGHPQVAQTLAAPMTQELADTAVTQFMRNPSAASVPIPGYDTAESVGRAVRDRISTNPHTVAAVNHPVLQDMAEKALHQHGAARAVPPSVTQGTIDRFKSGLRPPQAPTGTG